jgi:hypothetical protein
MLVSSLHEELNGILCKRPNRENTVLTPRVVFIQDDTEAAPRQLRHLCANKAHDLRASPSKNISSRNTNICPDSPVSNTVKMTDSPLLNALENLRIASDTKHNKSQLATTKTFQSPHLRTLATTSLLNCALSLPSATVSSISSLASCCAVSLLPRSRALVHRQSHLLSSLVLKFLRPLKLSAFAATPRPRKLSPQTLLNSTTTLSISRSVWSR